MQEALRFLPPDAGPVDRVDFIERAHLARRGSQVSQGLPLTIHGLRKSFGDNEVLRGIDLHVPAGQFVAIVGRSGCGKSTLLRLIAGLETIDAGTISFGEEARLEDVRVMFQEPRLLPWARVLSNVEVGLGRERTSPDAQRRAEQALAEVGRKKPFTAIGTGIGDIARRLVPGFEVPNVCDLLLNAPFES